MGIFEKMFAKKAEPAGPVQVLAPIQGTVIPLENIPDAVFSQGILGPGFGIEPEQETVYAPFNGAVTQVTGTKHALGLTAANGAELLIHVGMDTVDMNGDGFVCFVKEGQKVKAGDKLMTFSLGKIKAAGHPATTAVVVTNGDDYPELKIGRPGAVTPSTPVITF